MQIPKIIHQTFSRLHPDFEKNIAKIKDLNPGWEYRFYDDSDVCDFISKNYSSGIVKYFSRINPIYGAARADLFRYLLMYKCGGVYLDIKSTLTKPLDDVLLETDVYLLSGWPALDPGIEEPYQGWGLRRELYPTDEIQNWHIVTAPHNPFLRAVISSVIWNIDNYHPAKTGVGHWGVLRLTGPIAYTQAITPLLPYYKHRIADSAGELGFAYSMYSDQFAHHAIFGGHYSRLDEPIVMERALRPTREPEDVENSGDDAWAKKTVAAEPRQRAESGVKRGRRSLRRSHELQKPDPLVPDIGGIADRPERHPMRIPKIIHQTFSRLHPDFEKNIADIRDLNPGWEYRFYDDSDVYNFISKNYSSGIAKYFSQINPKYGAARADLFRYLLMYKCGGVYLDVKSTLTKPLDAVLLDTDVYLLSHWNNKRGEPFEGFGLWGLNPELHPDGEFQTWHIVTAPLNPFLRAVITSVIWNIDNYHPTKTAVGQDGVQRLTGPIAYTRAITPLLQYYKHRIVDNHEELGFKYSIYSKPFAHRSILGDHYSDLYEPIVLEQALTSMSEPEDAENSGDDAWARETVVAAPRQRGESTSNGGENAETDCAESPSSSMPELTVDLAAHDDNGGVDGGMEQRQEDDHSIDRANSKSLRSNPMKIACLMGTYGRYSLACEALACFLRQTKLSQASLLIYNQHPIPLHFDHPNVRVINEACSPRPLRHIKQRMLDLADPSAEFIHFWDDDDLYLPWHLEDCLRHIGTNVAWKPVSSWFLTNEKFSLIDNMLEASWIFRADYIRAALLDTHPAYMDHPVFMQTREAGKLATSELGGRTSYIYRWWGTAAHLSPYGGGSDEEQQQHVELCRSSNTDVRADGRLVPADMTLRWQQYLACVRDQVTPAEWELNRQGVLAQPDSRVPEIRGAVERPERSSSGSNGAATPEFTSAMAPDYDNDGVDGRLNSNGGDDRRIDRTSFKNLRRTSGEGFGSIAPMKIACLMGTYGRYSLACEALACFLQQTKLSQASLLIYNQHPVPLNFDHPNVRVINEVCPPRPLREIRKRMLDLADPSAEFIHFWDDDDLYLPWHLADCLRHIGANVAWRPAACWLSERNVKFSRYDSWLEASWMFRADYLQAASLETHPAYTDHPVFMQTEEAGTLATTELGGRTSYIYRWDTGTQHLSGYGGFGSEEEQRQRSELWRNSSSDVRPDGTLVAADMTLRWRQYLAGVKDQVTPEEWELNRQAVLAQPSSRVPEIRSIVDRPERSSSGSNSSRMAYLIVAHAQPNHLARLIDALDQDDSYFFIHVDAKVPIQPFKDAVPQHDNIIFVSDRVTVEWGTFSLVEAELRLIQAAIALGLSFKYYTVLSGSDYPIKDKQEIVARLQASDRQHIRIDCELTPVPKDPSRHPPLDLAKLPGGRYYDGMTPYKGCAYWSLTEGCIHFICDFVRDNPGYVDVNRNVFAADEVFFHTLVKHSPFAGEITQDYSDGSPPDHVRHALHFVDWAGLRERSLATSATLEDSRKGYSLTLDERDLDDLFASGCMFARKFDEQKSKKLLDMIDASVHWPKIGKNRNRSLKGSAMPELTIGMATYNDYDGVYFTLEALRLYQDLENTELLVIDNYGCDSTRDLVRQVNGTYHRATDVVGTSAPRDLVFSVAAGNAVLCCDCHILFVPGAIARLKQYYRDHPETEDLLQGPVLWDDGAVSTHFAPEWHDKMWGTWGTDPRGEDPTAEPFEIPMQGLGVFSCRKSAWLGFNSAFRGFGGEEGYIHEKFRQQGRRCLCLPWFRWVHRFYPPEKAAPYNVILHDRIVNYLLGHLELGLSIEPVITHFKDQGFDDTRQAIVELEGRHPQYLPELRRQLARLSE